MMENSSTARILCLYEVFFTCTDAKHPLSISQLANRVQLQYGFDYHRVTLKRHIDAMRECGIRIEEKHSNPSLYWLASRPLHGSDIRLLLDAVAGMKSISPAKSRSMIKELIRLASVSDQQKLQQRLLSSQAHADSDAVIELLQDAIDAKQKISFRYYEYGLHKEAVFLNNGEPYTLSPYLLMWNAEYYYLLGWCDNRGAMRTFRVDHIAGTPQLLPEKAVPMPEDFDPDSFCRSTFRMYADAAPVDVTLHCDADMMNHIIDQFGPDVDTAPSENNTFLAHVSVAPGPTFFRWVFCYEGRIRISAPAAVKNAYKAMLRQALEQL